MLTGLLITGCSTSEPVQLGSGPPATLTVTSESQGHGFVGNVLPAPTVRVLDAEGLPLLGVAVRFSLEDDGSLAWPVQYTDQRGQASAGAWRLGTGPGSQRIIAEAGELTATVTLEAMLPPEPSFTIAVQYARDDGLHDNDKHEIVAAARRWEAVVLGDLPDLVMPTALPEPCPDVPDLGRVPIDDLLLLISAEYLQNAAAITTICARRPGGGLPSVALIRLDVRKARLSGGVRSTMAHEIGHALGIGTLWGADLLDYSGELRYGGKFATAAFALYAGPAAAEDDRGVPVESKGGSGVARVHWSEEVFGDEILTPYPRTPRRSSRSAGSPSPHSATSATSRTMRGRIDSLRERRRLWAVSPVTASPQRTR